VIDAPLAYAFGVGMVATVNPCGFAMLPAYLSFFLGLEEADADTEASVLHALVIGGTVTAGFLVVFGLLGILLDGALSSLQDWLPWVTIVLGFVLVGLGIALLAGRSFALRIPTPRQREGSQLLSVFVFGVSYALVSLSCTIPLFIAAVAPSFTDANFASGVAAFLAYGLGMGVVLIALTVALALAKHSLVRNLRKVLPYVYKISGVLLIVAGLYVAYYGWYELRVRTGETSGGGAAQVVFDWNASISSWVQQIGPVRLGIVLAAAVGVVVALTMGTRRRPEPADRTNQPNRVEEPTDRRDA
jgi:cytochrome c-type biogenesis protein